MNGQPSAGSERAYGITGHPRPLAAVPGGLLHLKLMLERVERKQIPVVQACQELGVARSWFYELRDRYRAEGEAGLRARTRKAPTSRRLPQPIVDAILSYALRHPRQGERAIARALDAKENGGFRVSHAAVGIVLRRAGLSTRFDRAAASSDRRVTAVPSSALRPNIGLASAETVPESHVIRRAADGDTDAMATFYTKYRRAVLSVCTKKLGDAALAEDATQDTFMRAFAAIGRFEDGRNPLPWLLSIARNRCVDMYRGDARTTVMDPTEDFRLFRSKEPSPLDGALASERNGSVRIALRKLPPRQRRVLMLYAIDGWSHQDIADAEGISRMAIKSLIFRARHSLRQRCGEGFLGGLLLPLRRLHASLVSTGSDPRLEPFMAIGANQLAACIIALVMAIGGIAGSGGSPRYVPVDRSTRPLSLVDAKSDVGHLPDPASAEGIVDPFDPEIEKRPNRVDAFRSDVDDVTRPNHDINRPEQTTVSSIVPSPSFDRDRTIFAVGAALCTYVFCPPSVLFRSQDAGTTWQRLAALDFRGSRIVLPPNYGRGDSRIFATGKFDVQVSEDDGKSFRTIASTTTGQDGGAAISPRFNADEPIILIGANSMMQYDDRLDAVTPSAYSSLKDARDPSFSPDYGSDGLVLIGGRSEKARVAAVDTKPHIYACRGGSCSTSDLSGWEGDLPHIRFPATYPRTSSIFAFTTEGILRSIDGGRVFSAWHAPWHDGLRDLAVSTDGTRLAAAVRLAGPEAGRNGIYISDDGGVHWRRTRDRLLLQGAAAVQIIGDRIIAGTPYGLACSSDAGTTWARSCAK